jgi:Mlc titration factor MtfA (ptsG expression regulator)
MKSNNNSISSISYSYKNIIEDLPIIKKLDNNTRTKLILEQEELLDKNK